MADIKTEIGVDIKVNADSAVQSVGNMKTRLREAQKELLSVREQFGETSKEAIQAAKRVAELRDEIGDAKLLTDAFNPDAKFKAFSSAIQGVVGGFAALQGAQALFGSESEDVAKVLAKVQGALALTQGVDAILEAKDSFKVLKAVAVDALSGIRKGLLATGIGVFVVALGTIVAYWDDIKEAVSGVGEEQKKLNETQKKSLETSQKELDAFKLQENSLKLQGKSEKEILQLKLKKLDVTIKDAEAQVKSEEAIAKQREAAAKRNFEITKQIARAGIEISTLGLRILAAPIDAVLVTANKVSEALGFGKITTTNLNAEISKINESVAEFGAKFLFDSTETKKEGDAAVKAAKDTLAQLVSDRDGVQLQINQIDKAASDKRVENAKEEAQKLLEINKQFLQERTKLEEENFLASIQDEDERARQRLFIDFENERKRINQSQFNAEQKAELLKQLEIKAQNDLDAINQAALEKAQEKEIERQNKLKQTRKEEFDREQQELKNRADQLLALAQDETLSEEQRLNALAEREKLKNQIVFASQDERTKYEKSSADERKKIAEAEAIAKENLLTQTSSILSKFSDVVGRETAVGKGLAIASATIDTYVAATKALKADYSVFGPAAQVARFASVAATIALGLKQVKEIARTKVPGGGGGGAVPSVSGISAPLQPQLATTTLNQGQINQLSSATNRSFVLETDVSGNQERIRRINRAARIN